MQIGRCFLVPVFLCSPMVVEGQAQNSLSSIGRRIAADHCTRCHVVGDVNPNGGISSTPSFHAMVNSLSDWKERFITFHIQSPHPAVIRFEGLDYSDLAPPTTVPITLTFEDIEALTAYAETLKQNDR